MKSRVAIALFCGVALLGTSAYALTKWVESPGDASCKTVCEAQALRPVVSGKYKNGSEFYTCAGNAQGEGLRAGYNLNGGACVVGWGGKEIPVRPFQCLCD